MERHDTTDNDATSAGAAVRPSLSLRITERKTRPDRTDHAGLERDMPPDHP